MILVSMKKIVFGQVKPLIENDPMMTKTSRNTHDKYTSKYTDSTYLQIII